MGFRGTSAKIIFLGRLYRGSSAQNSLISSSFALTPGFSSIIAAAISPAVKDYLILAHGSSEPGHRTMARLLGKKPLLDLGLHLGEGSGAALAMPLLDAAREVLTGMATFESANVTSEGVR